MDANHAGWTYAAIMLAALACGVSISRSSQSRLGLRPLQRLGIGLGAFCGGIIGAKLPFLLADGEAFLSGRAWFESGKTITVGLAGGYLGVELVKWALDIRVKTGDSFAVPVAASIGIGRLACYFAGCCHGTVTALPWGVDFGDGLRRHPTQIYELVFHLSAAVALAVMRRYGVFRGQLIKLYIITYFLYRFATEFIRPEPELWLGLSFYQWSAAAFVPLFAALWVRDRGAVAAQGAP